MIMLQADDAKLKEQLQAAIDAVRRGAQGLREVVNDLRLEDEEGRPFTAMVESLVKRNRTMARKAEISLNMGEEVPSAPLGETGAQVSRVIQEALTNARRHAGAEKTRSASGWTGKISSSRYPTTAAVSIRRPRPASAWAACANGPRSAAANWRSRANRSGARVRLLVPLPRELLQ
jgi:signal transduction histidine kinase